jgi:tetratricopeptide (TPR) repeat protein
MPTLDDLNDIKARLLTLGDEPGILAAKGETPVDIGPPETGISDDLNALFDNFSDIDQEDLNPESADTSGSEIEELNEESGENLFEDFDLDLEDDEPALNMDGFDAPEPDSSVPEQFDTSASSVQRELTEPPVEGDIDEVISEGPGLTEGEITELDDPEDLVIDIEEPEDTLSGQFEDSDSIDTNLSGLNEDQVFDDEDFSLDDSDFGEIDDSFLSEQSSVETGLPEQDSTESDIIDEDDFDEGMDFDLDSDTEDLGFEELIGITANEESLDKDLSNTDIDVLDSEESLDFDDAGELDSEESLDFDDAGELDSEESLDLDDAGELDSGEALAFDDTDGFDSEEALDFDDSGEFNLGDDPTASEDIDFIDEDEISFDDTDSDDIDLSGGGLDFEDATTSSDDLALDEFEISEESFDEDLEIDEFDLGDLGQDFGVLEADNSPLHEEELAIDDDSDVDEELEEDFELSEKSFEHVKTTLQNLPRNLKIIIEEEIGEKGLKGLLFQKLINALAEGKTPKEIASITSKIVGRKIRIPANYSKQTGVDFEEEKGSFQYTLIHNILPLLKIFLISSLLIAAISFGVYKFIYRPVHAYILYNRGYEQLEESNYNSSADLFEQAFEKYKMKKQFYRYADGYIESKQWEFARTQYNKLLINYPFDKQGTIDYASMEFEKLSDYEHSTEILNNYLAEDKYNRDYEALILLGDIFLEWGWENKEKYEDARLAYAKIMSTYGIEDKILFRMLRYFIRTDNAKEVETLKKRFEMDKELEIDPLAYAELAGYQIDRNDIADVQELLFRAKNIDESIPEIHYQLARLFNRTSEGEEEDKALIKTLSKLDNLQTLNRRKREIKIDTYRHQGERFYDNEEFLQAEEVYNKGLDLLEESRERNIIKGKSNIYGELYSDLGHIYYYISENPDNALDFYEKAENEGFYSPEIFYNKGNIRYRSGEFRQALLEFYNSAGSFSVNTNLLQSTANTLYQRNDFFAAQGYYSHLLDILEMKMNREFSIRITEREDHRLMVEDLMKAYNNMGVTLYGLFERTGDPSKFTAAMLSFTQSNEYFDDLTRDPETLNRTDMINLASLNQRKMLYPIPEYELQIFADIPKYLAPR